MSRNEPAAFAKLRSSTSLGRPLTSVTGPELQKAMPAVLYVRRATADDLQTILGFIAEASSWLQQKGIDQWANPWPTVAARDERVRSGLAEGRTWMVQDSDGTPIATITCRRTGNPDLWTPADQKTPAVYVSRLIVRRGYAGWAIGAELLDWAGKRAADKYGAQWIRIDVGTTNVALHGYYEKRKFSFIRFDSDSGYPSAALFQRTTADIQSADITRLRQLPDLATPQNLAEQPDHHPAGRPD